MKGKVPISSESHFLSIKEGILSKRSLIISFCKNWGDLFSSQRLLNNGSFYL